MVRQLTPAITAAWSGVTIGSVPEHDSHHLVLGAADLLTSERLLLRDDESIQLTPKAFDTLTLLVENVGHLVEKDTLMEAIWPNTFVDENTLTRNISTLRKALGEDGNGSRYIETVPKL